MSVRAAERPATQGPFQGAKTTIWTPYDETATTLAPTPRRCFRSSSWAAGLVSSAGLTSSRLRWNVNGGRCGVGSGRRVSSVEADAGASRDRQEALQVTRR